MNIDHNLDINHEDKWIEVKKKRSENKFKNFFGILKKDMTYSHWKNFGLWRYMENKF